MQKCAKKTVLSTVIVRNASTFTLKNAAYVMMALLFITIVFGCAKEDLKPTKAEVGPLPQDTTKTIIDHFANSSRSLFVSATPRDSFCYSVGIFDMYSTLSFSNEDGTLYDMKLTPTASVRIELTPARQEVKSEAEIPTSKVSSKTISQSKTNNGLLFVFKKHQQDTYADGSKADIYLEWTARGYINADGDTLMTGHVEFGEIKLDSLSYARHGERTEYDDPFYVTHHYSIPYMEKGVTGQQRSFVLPLKPYREKSITDDPQVKTGEPTYDIKWEGCPVTKLNLVQTTPTNKGNVVVKESFDVVFNVSVPEAREQASLDSTFAKTSKGELKYAAIGDTVMHANGFQSLNYTGGWTSRNKGLENGSNVETTATITASMPVKFANKWGSVDIKPLEPTFEEGGFVVTSVSQDADYHMFKTVNTIIPHLGDCTMDALDEIVNIKVAKDKPAVPVDSVYVKGGNGDSYTVKKTVYYSDGSKLEYPFAFDGKHSASAVNFGEKIVSNLSWSASELKDNGTSQVKDNGKVFTSTTRFEVTYVTTNKKSDASNGVESGVFGFSETHPVVVFIDGNTKLTFDERKVVLSGKGAQPASDYTLTVKDGISYKGYTYNMSAGVVFDGEAEADVTSQGLLLIVADVVGEAQYQYDYSWSGNTITVKTTKTIPHSFGEDEVEVYQTNYTVSMSDLENGKVYAENVDFTVKANNSEKSLEPVKDGFYTITPRERGYSYNVSNGTVSREMSNTVVDAVIVFNDGKGNHTWDASLAVSKSDSFGEARNDGDYKVTPLTTTVKAVAQGTNAPTLTVSGTTDIYVEQDKIGDTSYKPEESWNGNTFTAKVTRTIKHTKANDEVKSFDKSVTVSMSDLSDDKVYAANTSFTVTPTNTEKSDDDKDGVWTVTKREREYTYTVSNGAVKREMKNKVIDYTITFKEGSYSHTFNAQLTVSNSDKFGSAKTDGDYTVTPLTTTVKAVGNGTGAPTITKSGVTNIYVENPKEISYRFTYQVDDVDNGTLYADMLAERLVNGKVEKKWSCWGLAGKWGEYKPNVSGIWVTNINFRDNFSTTDHATDKGAEGLGDAKAFSMANISKIENHLSVLFDANPDADGNTIREVAGHINLWSYRYTFVDPDNGHKETLDFVITAKTTTHEVKNNVYHRVVEIQLNGQTVATQEGKVNVTVE